MPTLTWDQIAPEVKAEPMRVQLGPEDDAPVVRFLPFTELPGDDIDEIVELLRPFVGRDETAAPTGDELIDLMHAINRLRGLALHPDDREAWAAARIGVAVQVAIIRALIEWYGGAGTSGEGRGPASSSNGGAAH